MPVFLIAEKQKGEVYFLTGQMLQFMIDDLEKVPYGEERIIK